MQIFSTTKIYKAISTNPLKHDGMGSSGRGITEACGSSRKNKGESSDINGDMLVPCA